MYDPDVDCKMVGPSKSNSHSSRKKVVGVMNPQARALAIGMLDSIVFLANDFAAEGHNEESPEDGPDDGLQCKWYQNPPRCAVEMVAGEPGREHTDTGEQAEQATVGPAAWVDEGDRWMVVGEMLHPDRVDPRKQQNHDSAKQKCTPRLHPVSATDV